MPAQAQPHTTRSLTAQLRELGVDAGDVVLVHAARSRIGFVVGGRQAIVQALVDAVGAAGTLVVPTHTPENTDPATWIHPPVPQEWWPVIRDEAPGFDPSLTPATRWMGVLAESVRTWPGALRSNHPQVSFAAIGAHARQITTGHVLEDALGDSSPLGAINRLDGKILLLGVGHDSNTSLHLAQWRRPEVVRQETSSALRRPDGSVQWVSWSDPPDSADDFAEIGAAYEASGGALRRGVVGEAPTMLIQQRPLVDFASEWLASNA